MYVTLEPCCHTGKQPPCTDAIVQAGIARYERPQSSITHLIAISGMHVTLFAVMAMSLLDVPAGS